MWIITTWGFFSLVKKSNDADGQLTIRARQRGDLENLKALYAPNLGDIKESLDTDYRYRAQISAQDAARVFAEAIEDIDYGNFKDAVRARQGYARSHVYGQVWECLHTLQNAGRS